MKRSGLNRSYQFSGTDVSLLIIAVFCLFLVVFIGYRCCRQRKQSARKKKAHQRKLLKKGSRENGELLETASQITNESLDSERQDSSSPGGPLFKEKPNKHNKQLTSQNQISGSRLTSPSILDRILSALRRSGSMDSDVEGTSGSSRQLGSGSVKRRGNNGRNPESPRSITIQDVPDQSREPLSNHENGKQSQSSQRPKSNSYARKGTNGDPLGACKEIKRSKVVSNKLATTGNKNIYSRYKHFRDNPDSSKDNGSKKVADSNPRDGAEATNRSSSQKGQVKQGIRYSLDEGNNSEMEDDDDSGTETAEALGFDCIADETASIPREKMRDASEKSNGSCEDKSTRSDDRMPTTTKESARGKNKETFQMNREGERGVVGEGKGGFEANVTRANVTRVDATLVPHKPHERRIESIGNVYNVTQYARSEWKSETATAKAVREGYFQIPPQLGLNNLRVIRGDNYCAVRATVFQVLTKKIPVLSTLENIEQIPQALMLSGHNWIEGWKFGSRFSVERHKVCEEIKKCLKHFSDLVELNDRMGTEEGRISHLVANFNFKPPEYEIRLLEAVKFLMLYHAIKLHENLIKNGDVPVFAMIMFARDSSPDPKQFMTRHLNAVGDSGGLEQVEMHLLGYSLGVTIRVVRPSHFGQSDFIALYPDDMPDGAHMVTLVAEDDRHYNILS